ncbi:hypothetical protein FQN55_009256 [Onygenales sp. PD_40]|nr:hypothetical protein FQN55_009256 [Onygenales sp. PD_40]KAK2773576.1 hypothetical protein FQN53_004114 [Emmonsiellopsis sp. PD_33]KAK2781367.1 hypothetical protein FQN52_001660 [Onygenales sp. PD_12]KAK2798681.1 hypothetical protein FQN51_007543 [Onygenales sp. PD_10]
MPSTNVSHRRTHNLLLISKLLSLRDSASPLTLLLDSLEQSATPLIQEYIRRAKLSKVHTIFVSFETLTRPESVDTFITARRKTLAEIAKEVTAASSSIQSSGGSASNLPSKRSLIIIDSIHPLISRKRDGGQVNLANYLSSLLAPPTPTATLPSTSLIAIYHTDIPLPPKSSPYTPSPLSLLTYLATTILTVHSLSHILAEKAARDRSLMAPVFGLAEEADGVIIGRVNHSHHHHQHHGNHDASGLVIEMEHRRKSGRGVVEWYHLPPPSKIPAHQIKEVAILLDDHPLYRRREEEEAGEAGKEGWEQEPESTFDLGLTERQRREREGVVLPYFDAQKGEGPGEGGRILYDMGEEDDFDEEEDEI